MLACFWYEWVRFNFVYSLLESSVLFKSKYHFYLKAFSFYMLGRNQWSIWPMRSLLLLSSYHRTHTGKLFLEPSSSGQVHNLTAPSLIGLLTVSLASREDGHITGVSNKSRRLPPPHPTPLPPTPLGLTCQQKQHLQCLTSEEQE